MANLAWSNVTITGPANAITRLRKAVNSKESAFDFDLIMPTPKELLMESSGVQEMAIKIAGANPAMRKRLMESVNLPVHNSTYCEGYTPEYLNNEADVVAYGMSYIKNKLKYGVYDWYDWRRRHWHTKWKASDCTANQPDKTTIEYEFTTAWRAPLPLFEVLSARFPSVVIEIQTREENEPWLVTQYRYNAGHGEKTDEWTDEAIKAEYILDEE